MNGRISSPIILVCALFLLIGVLRLNDLSMYNPDSTRYLIWGNSLAQGRGFVDATQPVPDRYVIHAPLYALLIAPVEFMFPHSLVAVKIASIAWGIAAIVLCYFWLKGLLGKVPAIAGTIMLACNPLMLLYSTEALSEIPFLAAMLAMFVLCERQLKSQSGGAGSFVLLLICAALLPVLREVGVALVLACVMSFVIWRKPGTAALLLLAPALVSGLWYWRNHILVAPSEGSQSGNFALLFQHVVTAGNESTLTELLLRSWIQGKEYITQLSGMYFYPQYGTHQTSLIAFPSSAYNIIGEVFGPGKFIVPVIAIPLFVLGIYADFKRSGLALLRILAGLLYLMSILLYPIHDPRFLFPMLPLMIFYGLSGAKFLYRDARVNFRLPSIPRVSVVFAFMLIPNVVGIRELVATNLEYRNSPMQFYQRLTTINDYPPIFAQPWSLLASWVRQHTEEDCIIASPAKDIAPLVGERKILELDPGVPLPEFERILRDNGVEYLISPIRWDHVTAFEFLTAESRRLRFETIYAAANLRLIKIHSRYIETVSPDTARFAPADSSNAGGLLKIGRSQMMSGNYSVAATTLTRALRLAPYQPDLVYQYAVVHALVGDTAKAISAFQALQTLPQSGSFLYATGRQLEAVNLLSGVHGSPEVQEIRRQQAAAIYWNLGYPLRASEIMDNAFRANSQYFFGLLWGFHYAFQRGDTALSRSYFGRLRNIDSSNAVVKVYAKLLTNRDSLGRSSDPGVKSRLHLQNARLFRQIDLPEESIDEAEWSLGAMTGNNEAAEFLREAFELKKSPRGMRRYEKTMPGSGVSGAGTNGAGTQHPSP